MISAPACYGKLPAFGDYLQHRAPSAEAGLWWNRFSNMPEPRTTRTEETLPWCFVLAPDVFSWAAGVHVVGALMLSRDRIGRSYPFIVWQKAKPQALRLACLFGEEMLLRNSPNEHRSHNSRNWLFWLSRLVFAHVRPMETRQTENTAPQDDFPTALDKLWEPFRPAWTARFGVAGTLPAEDRHKAIIGPCAPLDDVEGVRFMPWNNWPQALWEPRALCWFWQQDHEGRYLRVLRDTHFGKRVLAAILHAE